ncbi:hypothetical protein BCV70DRAFT_201887 [Testicularia cyperi]|uniref:Uncharacterized protein n=1 Tax=Testicularia cyperi TaxID=1882483 RepID=A0A317XJR1_9BASI|nr:hypothetical protein BCV70DRAFT_201887 [Testicularia cyperi]
MSYCSTDTSPVSHSVRTFTDSTVMTSTTSVDRDGPAASTSSAPTKKGLPCPNAVSPNSYLAMFAPLPPVPGQDASSARGGPEQPPLPPGYEPTPSWAAIKALEPDQLALNPDPHQLLQSSYEFVSSTASTQCTNGYRAFMRLLHEIAKLEQGQAMAHALAAVTATHQANFAKAFTPATEAEGTSPVNLSARPGTPASGVRSPGSDALRQQTPSGAGNASGSTPGLSGESSHRSSMLDLADRHHVAAIKALQQQHTPNRRRRFSIIDAPTSAGSDLPIGSNAGVMLLLIMACNQAGKSLMLPSYFNQCEEFLADAVEHISSHRMFPSITGEAYGGTPDDPPVFVPQNLNNYGHLLVVSTFVGIFQSYLAQYAAVTDWDYNPSRLRRLQPYDWAEKDADIWTSTRCSAAETTYSISMLTLELVVETLDKVRKFRRAEQAAYGNRQSSRSEAESSVAALESLALRGEIDLLIKNLESGSLWQGAIRILSPDDEDEVFAYLDALSSDEPVSAITQSGGNYVKAESPSRFSPVLTNTSTSTSPEPRSSALATDAAAVREGSPSSKMNVSSTGSLKSGSLFIPSSTGTGKQVNRIRLGNHLYRSALMVDLYLSVFNLAPSTQVIRNLVSRAIRLLEAVPMLHEMGLIWPVLVLGSHAQGVEREQVRVFLKRSQWKGSAGPGTAAEVLERVWSGQVSDWRAGVNYFGKPFMT